MKVLVSNGDKHLDFESHSEFDEFVSAVGADSLHESDYPNKKLDKFISSLLKIQKNTKNHQPPFFKISTDELDMLNNMTSPYKTKPFLDVINNIK